MGYYAIPQGKGKLIDGERRHTKFRVGKALVKFALSKEDNQWYVNVNHPLWGEREWQTLGFPCKEVALMAEEVAGRAYLREAHDDLYLIHRIAIINKKFPRADFDRIFAERAGWTFNRKKRKLRQMRNEGWIARKGKKKFSLTVAGVERMQECMRIIGDYEPPKHDAPKAKQKKKG